MAMNNKGNTLVEVIVTIVLITIIIGIAFNTLKPTLSIGKEEAYELMKNNIINISYDYINECQSGTLDCDFNFTDNNEFNSQVLLNAGFIKSLDSPIDGTYLGECLKVKATKSNGVVVVDLVDNCY